MERLGVMCLGGMVGLILAGAAEARITRIVIDEVRPFAEPPGSPAYVAAVRKAAARAVTEGFLLPEDAADLVSLAEASHVLR